MKKNTKLLIGSAAAVAVLGIALTCVLLLPSDENQITANDNNDLLLFDKTSLTAESISINNAGGDYELLAYEYDAPESSVESLPIIPAINDSDEDDEELNVIYTMQEYPDYDLDKKITDDIASQCCYMAARELIDKSGQRYTEYGLDKPVATVSVRYSDASEIKFYIGNDAPDNKGLYLRLDGDRNVYLVQTSMVNALLVEGIQVLDKTLTGSIDEFKDLLISGTNYQDEIHIAENTLSCYSSLYMMEEPARYGCDNTKTNSILNSVSDLKAEFITVVDATEDDIKKYGLDDPYESLTVVGKEGNPICLIASEPDENKCFYMMNTDKSIIYQDYVSENSWYNVKKSDFLSDSVFKCKADAIQELTLKMEHQTAVYHTEQEMSLNEQYYETMTTTVTRDNEKIDYSNYSLFLSNLSDIKRTSDIPDSLENSTELFRADFKYFNLDSVTDSLVLYREKSGKTIAVLNGNIESYVDSEFVDSFISVFP